MKPAAPRLQGTVLLYLEVDREGSHAQHYGEAGLGTGPGRKGNRRCDAVEIPPWQAERRAISTSAMIEVNFRLL